MEIGLQESQQMRPEEIEINLDKVISASSVSSLLDSDLH